MQELINSCSICGTNGLVQVMWIMRKGVPHGSAGHNVQYMSENLLSCPQCKRGWLQSSDHDCWDVHETWDMYWWYMLELEDMQRIDALLEGCPTPLDPQCSCDLHRALRAATERLSAGVPHEGTTRLRRVSFASLSLIETEKGPLLKVKK